jgi:O-antigen ligase
VAAGFFVVAGFASPSKLGAPLIVVGMAALGLAAARTWRQRAAMVALVGVLAAAGALVSSGTRLGERVGLFLGRSQDALMLEGRLVAWQASGQMFLDFPLTGAGFGAFQEVFARYVPAGTAQRWSHAHNDYIELLLDGGLVAAALVLWLLAGYARRVARTFRNRDVSSPGRLGLLVGVVALAVHAVFDFNHQIPANALLWVTCCAMLLSGNRRRAGRGQT